MQLEDLALRADSIEANPRAATLPGDPVPQCGKANHAYHYDPSNRVLRFLRVRIVLNMILSRRLHPANQFRFSNFFKLELAISVGA